MIKQNLFFKKCLSSLIFAGRAKEIKKEMVAPISEADRLKRAASRNEI